MDPTGSVVLTAIWASYCVILVGLQRSLGALFGFLQRICEDVDVGNRDSDNIHITAANTWANVATAKTEATTTEAHVTVAKMEFDGDGILEANDMERDKRVSIGMPRLRHRQHNPTRPG